MIRKILYKILYPIYKTYWFVFRPKTFGVKCVVECKGKILMIRNAYGRKRWTFPGGKIEKGESSGNAAKREVKEEVGLDVCDLISIGQFLSTAEKKKDTISCFKAKCDKEDLIIDLKEILTAEWFLPVNLPGPMSPVAEKVLDLWKNSAEIRKA